LHCRGSAPESPSHQHHRGGLAHAGGNVEQVGHPVLASFRWYSKGLCTRLSVSPKAFLKKVSKSIPVP
jgi:hypothetical protein